MSLVSTFWVNWRKVMHTRETPDFRGLHKNMNCAFPLKKSEVVRVSLICFRLSLYSYREKLNPMTCVSKVHVRIVKIWPFVNLDIKTSALELELQTWWFRMRRPHPQSHVTFRYCGHVTNEGTSPTKFRETSTTRSRDKSKTLYLDFHKAYRTQT